MGERVLVSGGRLLDPSTGTDTECDLVIEDGRVASIEKPGATRGVEAASVIDARGKWLAPGFIDVHVHLREPGFEWKETIETGSRAAVLGGFTSICCMPNTNPVNDSEEVTKYILRKASDAGLARVLPIGAVSVGLKGKQMAALSELRQAGCVAFSDDGEPVFDSGLMRRALEWCTMLDAVICCHEEDKNLSCGGCMNESPRSTRMGLKGWPTVAEEVMIARDIELARVTKGRVHFCHVTTARGVELVRRAKADHIPVTAEVTPHHLILTEERVDGYDTNAKMSPPLRSEEDVEALYVGINDGTIDVIASDHAPHDRDSKEKEFSQAAFGILGLQTSLPLVIELINKRGLRPLQAMSLLSTGSARLIGIEGGALSKGRVADCVVIDPNRRWSLSRESVASKSLNSPFIGSELTGAVDDVLIGGRSVVRAGSICGGPR